MIGTSNIIFRDGLFRLPVSMSGGGVVSQQISCNDLMDLTLPPGQQTRGSLTPAALVFSDAWVTSDVVFTGYLDNTFTNGFLLNTGGTTNGAFTISSCTATTLVPLPISIFSCVKYFTVTSIIPQVNVTPLTLILFPLEQLSA